MATTNNSCDYSPTQYNVQVGGANGTLSNVAPSATSGVPVISQGAASNPTFGTAVVAGGGTGLTSATAYAVLCGGTTSTGAFQSIAGLGSSGNVLTSNGAGALPTFQAAGSSSITITGDSGGGLTGNSFTFTGGTTGLTFAGAGTTETLGGTLVVSNGGTGRASSTAYAVICGGTTSTAAQQSVAALGASGTVLTSNGAGALPTFQAAGSSSITITGDSGGGLTGNSFTFTGGTTGLTFAGAGSTETLGGTLVVANGGTGDTSLTAYAVLCGGTTSTGAVQSIASVGSSGNVLTSNGAGALPTFQSAPGGGIVQSATTTLTSAQVKALHATPITILSAPGSGKLINIINMTSQLNYGGTNAFVNGGGQVIQLYLGTDSTGVAQITGGACPTGMITATSSKVNAIYGGFGSSLGQQASTAVLNKALVVSQSSATEISGNAAGDNTISITVWYVTVTP